MKPYEITPYEIYNLPTLQKIPWFDNEDIIFELFTIESQEIDLNTARKDKLSSIEVNTKLSCYVDNASYVRISSISISGESFALAKDSGYKKELIVTDPEKFREARKEIEKWKKLNEPNVISDCTDINDVFCSTFVVRYEDEVRLVPVNHVNIHGTKLLFDEVKYNVVFDEIVRPEFLGESWPDKGSGFEQGFENTLMRELACKAIEAAIPADIEKLVLNANFIQGLEQRHADNWHAVIVKDKEETYSIGISSYYKTHKGFSWAEGLHACLIGSSKIYDRIAIVHNRNDGSTLNVSDEFLEGAEIEALKI